MDPIYCDNCKSEMKQGSTFTVIDGQWLCGLCSMVTNQMSDPIRKRLDEIKSALDTRHKMTSRELELKWSEYDRLGSKVLSNVPFLIQALEIALKALESNTYEPSFGMVRKTALTAHERIEKLAAEGHQTEEGIENLAVNQQPVPPEFEKTFRDNFDEIVFKSDKTEEGSEK